MILRKPLLLLVITSLFTGCSLVPNLTKKDEKEKPETDVRIFADQDINPDVLGVPSPIRLSFLQLSTVVEFDQMNELSTDGSPYKTHLGNSVQDEINVTVRPKESLNFQLPLKDEAKYLGILAAYRDPANQWKISLVKQDPQWYQKHSKSNFLFIHVKADSIEQLSKQQAMDKILAENLKKQGKELKDLTQEQKDKLLKKIDKALKANKPANLKKGIFIQSSEVVDKASQVALPTVAPVKHIAYSEEAVSSNVDTTKSPETDEPTASPVAPKSSEANTLTMPTIDLPNPSQVKLPSIDPVKLLNPAQN